MTKQKKEYFFYLTLLALSVIVGYIYMSTGFNRALGGDDKDYFVRMYLQTKDNSYVRLLLQYIKETVYHMIHPKMTDRYFCLTTMNYAVWKFAAKSLTHYRVVLLLYTYIAILLTVFFIWKITDNIGMGIAASALYPLTVNVFAFVETNPLYSYQAIVQRTYIYWILALLSALCYSKNRKKIYLLFSFVLMYFSCMVLEVGYLLIFASFFIILNMKITLREKVKLFFPQMIAVLFAGIGYLVCLSANGAYGEGDTTVVLDFSEIFRTVFWQIESSFGFIPIMYSGYDFHLSFIRPIDILLSLILTAIVICSEKKHSELSRKQKMLIYLSSASMIIGPACLIGIVGKFQQGGFIRKDHGWIVSVIQNFGGVIAFTIIFNDFLFRIKKRIKSSFCQKTILTVLIVVMTCAGVYSRSSAVAASENNRLEYEMMQDSFANGAVSKLKNGEAICCNFYVWGNDERSLRNFILANSGKNLNARVYEGTLIDTDEWYASYNYIRERELAFLYVGKISNSINDISDVSLWIETVSKESMINAIIVWVQGDKETCVNIDESKIVQLGNGRYGYLIEQDGLVDGNITFIGIR